MRVGAREGGDGERERERERESEHGSQTRESPVVCLCLCLCTHVSAWLLDGGSSVERRLLLLLLENVCSIASAPTLELWGSKTFPWVQAKEPVKQEAAFMQGTRQRDLIQGLSLYTESESSTSLQNPNSPCERKSCYPYVGKKISYEIKAAAVRCKETACFELNNDLIFILGSPKKT